MPKPFILDFSEITRSDPTKVPTPGKVPGVDVKPSGNYLEIDFFYSCDSCDCFLSFIVLCFNGFSFDCQGDSNMQVPLIKHI